jgi:predicted RNA polymerase sigma factor
VTCLEVGDRPEPAEEADVVGGLLGGDGDGGDAEIVDGLTGEPALAGYHHLPSVRGDLLARLGRDAEAALEFRRAAGLTRNIPERTVLLRRAAACDERT